MSVILGLKYKDGVVLAADTQTTASSNGSISINKKIFKTKYSNMGIGAAGDHKINNVLEVMNDPVSAEDFFVEKKIIDRPYVIKHVVPSLWNEFKTYNCVLKDSEGLEYLPCCSQLLICTPNEIMLMHSDGTVVSFKNFYAIGCGDNLVIGYLKTINEEELKNVTKEQAIELAKRAIKESCKDNAYINDNIDVIVIEKN